MGFFSSLRQPIFRSDATTRQATPAGGDFYYTPEGWLGGPGGTGADLALTLSALWKGVRILSEGLASFQCSVHERMSRGHAKRSSHALSWSLGRVPNDYMTAFELWETSMVHLVLRGNAYARRAWVPKAYDGFEGIAGIDLRPVHPDRVRQQRRPNGTLDYTIRDDRGQPIPFAATDILHLKGMSQDGIVGLALTSYASRSLKGMLGAESFAARFYKQGAMAAVAAVPERNIGPEGVENLTKSVRSYLVGLENAHSVFVPPDKVTLQTLGIDPEKAQLLATRQHSTEEIAHWLNLPPGMLGDSKTPTFASSRQFREDLVDLCFRPWAERIEARIDSEILRYADDNPLRYFVKFEMDSLLRGNSTERSQIQERDIRAGHKTRNEARLENDLEPLPGLDEPIVALNMGNRSSSDGNQAQMLARGMLVVREEASRLVRKEIAAASKAAERFAADGAAWQAWLRDFYGQHGREVSARLCLPLPIAEEYAARQGLRLAERGVKVLEDWERTVTAELAELALCPSLDAATRAVEENAA